MDAWVWILIAVVVVLIILALAWSASRRRRTEALKERFGPEYDRTVRDRGHQREAEAELEDREKRRRHLDIRPLSAAAAEGYRHSWSDAQSDFVDRPRQALATADRLIQDVMRERGYPVDDFEQRSADISVDHPAVVDDYRAAHTISEAAGRGEASTEDMRRAMQRYRKLFDDLLETTPGGDGDQGADDEGDAPRR